MSDDIHRRRLEDARIHLSRGDLVAARGALEDARTHAAHAAEGAEAAAALATVLDRLGDGAQAEALLVEALRVAGPRAGWSHDLGIVLFRQGRLADAAARFEDAAAGAGDDDEGRVRALEPLAQAYLDLGQLRRAESAFGQMAFTAERLGDPPREHRARNGRGEALRRMGRRPEAWGAFEGVVRALESVQTPDPQQNEAAGIALHNLGVYSMDGDPPRARALLDGAVGCFVAAFGGRQHPHVARSVAFLGRLALDEGDGAKAAAHFAEARCLVAADDPVVTELLPMLEAPSGSA